MVIVGLEWETIRDDGSHGYSYGVAEHDKQDQSEPDELVVDAAGEVDASLLDWALSMSPRERLRACANSARTLAKFQHAQTEDR